MKSNHSQSFTTTDFGLRKTIGPVTTCKRKSCRKFHVMNEFALSHVYSWVRDRYRFLLRRIISYQGYHATNFIFRTARTKLVHSRITSTDNCYKKHENCKLFKSLMPEVIVLRNCCTWNEIVSCYQFSETSERNWCPTP